MHTRTFKDSGYIQLTNSSTVINSAIYVFPVDERFKPYNEIEVINNSDEDIAMDFNFNTNFKFIVPKGNQRTFNIICEDIRFKNLDVTTISIGEIILTIRATGIKGQKLISKSQTGLSVLGNISLVKNLLRW